MDNFEDGFLHRLKWARSKKFSSQVDFISAVNEEPDTRIGKTQWNRMENGSQSVPIELLPVICKTLECSLDWLLLGVEGDAKCKFSIDAQMIAKSVDDLDADLKIDVIRFAHRATEIQEQRAIKDKEISRLNLLLKNANMGDDDDVLLTNGFVYFISSPDSSAVKIGFSTNPKQRIKALATASAHKLELLRVIPGTVEYEKSLHDRFSDFRLTGEWFADSPQLREFIDSLEDDSTN